MHNRGILFIIVTLLFIQPFTASCSGITAGIKGLSRSVEPAITGSPDNFSFVIMADRTARERGHIFEESVDKINLLSPSFVINVGDIIEGYADPDQTGKEWDDAQVILSKLEMPFFRTPGNHDISSTNDLKEWHRRFGPTYYDFVYKNVLFIMLNSEGYRSVFPPDQIIEGYEVLDKQNEWLNDVLKKHSDVRWTFIFLHNPVWDYVDGVPPKWLEVEKMLGERPYTVFAGHLHEYTIEKRNNRDYITLATTGGMSDLKGTDYGQFDHVAFVSMKDKKSPVIANLMLSGIYDKNIRNREWRDLIAGLTHSVTIEPVFDDGNMFLKGITRFRVKNPGQRDVSLKIEATARDGVTVKISPEYVDLKPSMEQLIELEMKTDKPVFYGAVKPVKVVFTYSIERPSGGMFDLKHEYTLYPQTYFHCPLPPDNVSIDGVLDEWGELPFSSVAGMPETLIESGDPALRFSVAADSKYLYIAGRVLDDELFFDKNRYNYEQDGILIHLDARKDPERSMNRGIFDLLNSGENRKMVITIIGPVESKVGHPVVGRLPEGSIFKGTKTDDGYVMEAAIPMEYLNAAQGEPCKAFRLNIGIYDIDPSKGGGAAQSMWRPDRFSDDALPGAGTFLLK